MIRHSLRSLSFVFSAAIAVLVIEGVAHSADHYMENKPGSGSGTKDGPFGLADLPRRTTNPPGPWSCRATRPGSRGGENAFKTGPAKDFYHVGHRCLKEREDYRWGLRSGRGRP